MRAAIYARVSTGRQERDQTIDSQLTALRQWATAQGHEIRTAEGLEVDGVLDPVQQGFTEMHGLQCGFCTPGFVVAMRAVLDKNPKATPAEVEHGLSGNICRCGTYQQMRDAIAALCGETPDSGERKGG